MRLCESQLKGKKDYGLHETILKEAYEKINKDTPVSSVQPCRLLDITGESFQSIKKFSWNFQERPGDTLFIGENGSGKTTVAELVYWALTGELTKSNGVQAVYTIGSQKPPRAVLDLSIDDTLYRIERLRKEGPELNFSLIDEEGEVTTADLTLQASKTLKRQSTIVLD